MPGCMTMTLCLGAAGREPADGAGVPCAALQVFAAGLSWYPVCSAAEPTRALQVVAVHAQAGSGWRSIGPEPCAVGGAQVDITEKAIHVECAHAPPLR